MGRIAHSLTSNGAGLVRKRRNRKRTIADSESSDAAAGARGSSSGSQQLYIPPENKIIEPIGEEELAGEDDEEF